MRASLLTLGCVAIVASPVWIVLRFGPFLTPFDHALLWGAVAGGFALAFVGDGGGGPG